MDFDFRNPIRRRTNEEMFDAAEQEFTRQAIAETDREIFNDALDLAPDDDDGDMELEQVEGWDGLPLSDLEIAHRNLYGDDETSNYDRQVALAADRELMADNDRLRQERDAAIADYSREFNAPERVEAMQAQIRDRLYQQYGVLGTDDARTNALINDIAAQQAHVQALNNDRINISMSRAHDRYGDEFGSAFEQLSRASQSGDRSAQMMVSDIMAHSDPGMRLMELSDRFGGTHRSSDAFTERYGLMGGRSAPSRGSHRARDLADEDPGYDDAPAEREIFESVFPSRY